MRQEHTTIAMAQRRHRGGGQQRHDHQPVSLCEQRPHVLVRQQAPSHECGRRTRRIGPEPVRPRGPGPRQRDIGTREYGLHGALGVRQQICFSVALQQQDGVPVVNRLASLSGFR